MNRLLAPERPTRTVRWHRVWLVGTLTLLAVTLLAGLGIWQLQRRIWKLELIRTVAARAHAAPHAIPPDAAVRPSAHEYEHVQVNGTYLPGHDTRVHASTDLGAGYWILSPLRTEHGALVLINRGFVSMDAARDAVALDPARQVTGLLRVSEGRGHWPRRNAPSQEQWYARDVAAMAAARGLDGVAPYFIDADAPLVAGTAGLGGSDAGSVWPVAGLTVLNFRNTHLGYAMTWFALAFMTLAAGAFVAREELSAQALDA
jgi:surfeit locus 1 family protein